MAVNNPSGDFYNPPSNLSDDYEEYNFEDLELDELFWQTNKPKEEHVPWRKANQTQGKNLKSQTLHNFQPRTKVYQKI